MDISVIMIDGGFRENTFGAEYFSRQDFPADRYEIIWVDFYDKVSPAVMKEKNINAVTLNHSPGEVYHSSRCFNKGIETARGELLVIPDADQVVPPDFLSRIWELHAHCEKLVVYPYRYDEPRKGTLSSLDFPELEKKCVLLNPVNYGGCLTVRKKWLLEINGYEQHSVFESGFHANGLDIYTRFKNYGMAIMWAPALRLYHPWHPGTLAFSGNYAAQHALIKWRRENLDYLAIDGIDGKKNNTVFKEDLFWNDFNKKNKSFIAGIRRNFSRKKRK